MVEIEKPPATQALALSGLRHRCSPAWVEQDSPIGHAHASRNSLKKTNLNLEEDPSMTSIRRRRTTKNRHVHFG